MTPVTTPEYRRQRNLADLRHMRDSIAELGLAYEWSPLDERMLRMEDLGGDDQEWFRNRLGKDFNGRIIP